MKFYLLNPSGVPCNPHLFPMFIDHWRAKGIEIVDRIQDAQLVLVDLHSRISNYDNEEFNYLMNGNLPIVTFDEWDRGGMSTEEWPYPLMEQQKLLFHHCARGVGIVHFCRLLDKKRVRFSNVFPYEKPVLHQESMVSADNLFNREFDVVGIMNTAPQRETIKKALESDGRLKCNIILGAEKIPLKDWINEHKRGKLFLSASGGGYSSEKPQHLFSVAAMLQERTDQLLLHEPIHLSTCIKIDSPPTKADIDTIVEVVNNKEKLYRLYENNYNFMTFYYSAECIAIDILNKILKHYA